MIEYVDPAPTFCRAVKHNGVIYFSGHCDGKKHDTIAGQTQALCERYEEWLNPGHAPARVCVEAKIPEGYFLEMSVVAALK